MKPSISPMPLTSSLMATMLANPDSDIPKIVTAFTGHALEELMNMPDWRKFENLFIQGRSGFYEFLASPNSQGNFWGKWRFAWDASAWVLTVTKVVPASDQKTPLATNIEPKMLNDARILQDPLIGVQPDRIVFSFGTKQPKSAALPTAPLPPTLPACGGEHFHNSAAPDGPFNGSSVLAGAVG